VCGDYFGSSKRVDEILVEKSKNKIRQGYQKSRLVGKIMSKVEIVTKVTTIEGEKPRFGKFEYHLSKLEAIEVRDSCSHM
jgi:hypothetical protein